MSTGLLAYAGYVPVHRLAPDSGVRRPRVCAAFDEDATTMAVAAARALRPTPGLETPSQVLFSTSTPTYLDRTNATAIHAALDLPSTVPAVDVIGTGRSTAAAIRLAASAGGLVLSADVRIGKPGSSDERSGADAGAALLFGEGDVVAELLTTSSRTSEFLDRWREPTSLTGEQWEERFGFERYAELITEVAADCLAQAGLAEADHVVIVSPNGAVTKRVGSLLKGTVSTGTSPVGFSGAADLAIALVDVLERAEPQQTVLAVSAADGADAFLFRTTDVLGAGLSGSTIATQLAGGRPVPYPTYLSWRGLLEREVPRRPAPERPAAPPTFRAEGWKYSLRGSRCSSCGFVHLPPARVCRECGAVDAMESLPVAGLRGTVATYTVDRLAYSPSPPVVEVVVNLDGGGRSTFEVADAEAAELAVGAQVEFTFRRLFSAGGVANYFWKARQVLTPPESSGEEES
ncbi:OB-fold domain-containing protein [Nocardioides sp. NPDC087217]|uniref:OB-fold domain-containing protein n=1 Tax=Nocardioides sp. NPDC087217 TaxID=3364335 RepID=UPI00380628F8